MKIIELGHVVFYVSSLESSVDFYSRVLGFPVIHKDLHTALFSGGRTHHELLLIEVGGAPKNATPYPLPGLYHVGFKIGDTKEELEKAYRELRDKGVHIVGATDHNVTHSLYILDPDNNELELYVDVSDSWKENPKEIMKPARKLPYLEGL